MSPIYAIFQTSQNSEFIEGIVTNPKFIKKSLKFLEGTVEKLKTLKPRDFVKMHVWIPCLEEQKKIADFLKSIDEIIISSEKEIANLETQKKEAMKKIFSQEVRFKQFDRTDFSAWQEFLISSVSDILTGYPFNSSLFNNTGNGKPVIRIRDINNGFISTYTTEKYDEKYIIHKGDILIGMDGDFDVREWFYDNCLLNQRVLKISGKCECMTKYLKYALVKVLKEINEETSATTVKHLSHLDLMKHTICIPCLKEQHLIIDFLSNFDEAIENAKKESELWKDLKKGLLQQMFV